MIDMAKKDILPAVSSYVRKLSETAKLAKECGADPAYEIDLVKKLTDLEKETYKNLQNLEDITVKASGIEDMKEAATFYHDEVLTAMGMLRAPADQLETLVGEKYWPYPTYGKMLFYV